MNNKARKQAALITITQQILTHLGKLYIWGDRTNVISHNNTQFVRELQWKLTQMYMASRFILNLHFRLD